ncbi:MAG: hypothetical protein H0V66_01660 [Bdellovibrionales bacterium]|nr:hypothetical protein [Bdellovibrionales bacterium]
MKYSLFFMLLISQLGLAQDIQTLPCYAQFKDLLTEWKVTGDWTIEMKDGLTKSMLVSTTENFGEWALAQKIEQGTVLARADERGRLEVTFKTEKCVKEVKPYVNDKISAQYFSDKEIANFIKKNKTGAIYVWSPRMSLSQNGLKEIKSASKALKLPVLMLMDKDVSDKEQVSLSKKMGKDVTRRVDSFDFKMRNVSMHFPALIVFKEGKIVSGVKYGYEKAEDYQRDLRSKLR